GKGAGRDRRAARGPHFRRIAPALRRKLPPAARARLHRAAAAGFLEIRRRKMEHRGTETTTVPAAGRRARRRGVAHRAGRERPKPPALAARSGVLATVNGTAHRSTERISSNRLLDLLGVGGDPVTWQKVAKR